MGQILSVDNLNVYYGAIHAIKGVSFEVNEGEVVTLIGANGAGKSTTLQTVSGLLHSRTGSIKFCGEDISRLPSYKIVERGLAQVPEGRRIFLQMSVQENLEMGAYTKNQSGVAADLEDVYNRFPRLRERRRQIARGAAPRLARQIVSHRLQNSIIKTTRLPVGNARVFGKSGLTE